jgi:hypothetical protein
MQAAGDSALRDKVTEGDTDKFITAQLFSGLYGYLHM